MGDTMVDFQARYCPEFPPPQREWSHSSPGPAQLKPASTLHAMHGPSAPAQPTSGTIVLYTVIDAPQGLGTVPDLIRFSI